MRAVRILSTGAALAGVTGLMMLPVSAGAAASSPAGSASASTISLTVDPRAIVDVASLLQPSVLSALSQLDDTTGLGLGGILTKALTQPDTLSLDSATASATLNASATDLTSATATSQPIATNLAEIPAALGNLNTLLNSLLGGQLLGSLPTALQTQLAALIGPLSQVTAPITGLASNLLTGVKIDQALTSKLDSANPHGASQQSPAIDFPNNPLSGSLAPFTATAVDTVGAASNHLSGPQAEADNTTTELSALSKLSLNPLSAQNISTLLTTIQNLENTLNQTVQAATAAVNAAPGAATQALTGVLGPTAGGAIGSITAPVQQAVTAGTQTVTQAVQNLTAQLNTLTTLTNNLNALSGLLDALNGVSLNNLVQTTGVTSKSLVEPQKGGVHGFATSTVADIQVLQLISPVLSQLTNGMVKSGVPLLEVKGASSSVDAFVDGHSTTPAVTSTGLGEIDLLGQKVLTGDQLLSGLSQSPTPVTVPGIGTLALTVTRGAPQNTNSDPTHRTSSVSALEITLTNTPASLATSGNGFTHNATMASPILPGGTILQLDLAPTAVDVSTSAPVAHNPTTATITTNPQLPRTGLFGPLALLAAAGLGAAGLGLRVVPAVLERRRSRR
jgi:hypothetical protein